MSPPPMIPFSAPLYAPQLRRRDEGAQKSQKALQLRLGAGVQARGEYRVPVHKGLQEVGPGPLEPGADIPEGLPVVELPDYGGAELIVHRPRKQICHALPDRGQVQAGHPRRLSIAGGISSL